MRFAMVLFLCFQAFGQTDPAVQAANTWAFQYRRAALGEVTHPYENGFFWDDKGGRGLVFGGHLGTYTGMNEDLMPNVFNTNMTYAFSFSDNRFSKIFPMDRPPKRCGPKGAYDNGLNLFLVFGGAYHGFFNGYLEPNIRLTGLAQEGRRSLEIRFIFAPWAFDCNRGQWDAMRPLNPDSPPNSAPYYGFNNNFAFAAEYGLCVMTPIRNNRVHCYSAWSNQWTFLPLNTSDPANPPMASDQCVTYDLKHGKMVCVFGNTADSGTWAYDVGGHSWSRLALGGDYAKGTPSWFGAYSASCYDSKNGVTVYLTADGSRTFSLDLDSMKWTERSPTGAPVSCGNMGEGLTYDPVNNVSVVFAAQGDEVWTYKFGPGIAGRPQAPQGATGVTDENSITLTWSGSATQYYIYRAEWEDNKTNSSGIVPGPYRKIDSTAQTTWTDNQADTLKKAGAFHSYYISAVSASGMESDPSDPVYTRLRVPMGLAATPLAADRVVLRWKPKKEADLAGYNVYRAQRAYPRHNTIKANKLNSALITGTPYFEDVTAAIYPDTLAMYVVTAVNRLGRESGLSPFATTAPDWVTNMVTDTLGKTISWSPPRCGYIARYNIYEARQDTFDIDAEGMVTTFTLVDSVTDTFWNYAARDPVLTYKIRAVNQVGQEGHFSDVMAIQTKDDADFGMYNLDFQTEKPVVDTFYNDLPQIAVEQWRWRGHAAGMDMAVHPNPFNPRAVISLVLEKDALLSVALFDAAGRRVMDFGKGLFAKGNHNLVVDGGKLPAGVYWCAASGHEGKIVRAVTLLK